MRLDRTHRGWAAFTLVALVAGAAAYARYASAAPAGPSGGSGPGLAFGIAAYALVLFAALLGWRRRVPAWRVGRASAWLRAHLWLGFLSLPLALFHAGFGFGGGLATALLWALLLVCATGILGAVLQHFLPRLVTEMLPQETVYEQIDHVRAQLFEDAKRLVEGGGGSPVPRAKTAGAIQGRVVESRAAVEAPAVDREPLRRFFAEHLRPYFEAPRVRRTHLWNRHERGALFAALRAACDPSLHPATRDLEALCAQREQLELQRRLHLWTHGWLFVHAPLAYAVVVLGAVHAVMSLYY
jgi:hypothetical protein